MLLQKYESLFDKCLYLDLSKNELSNSRQLQIRICDSLTHFSIYYTDGYTYKLIGFVKGYKKLKTKIKEVYNELN